MKYIFGLFVVTLILINKVESFINKCSTCIVYEIGIDGTLWGRENNSFCKISSKCKPIVDKKSKKRSTIKSIKKKTVKKSIKKKTFKKANKKTTTTTTTTTTTNTPTPTTPVPHQTDEHGNLICNSCIVTATGGDNSLWGWEEEKSCIIDLTKCQGNLKEEKKHENNKKSKADINFKKDASNNYICNGCEVTAVGSDNAYWGYENETSCIIDNIKCKLTPPEIRKTTTPLQRAPDGILICSTCEYLESDQSYGTWNFENGEICRVLGSRCGVNFSVYPWCSGCYVTSTGKDGALYGWENGNSCVINEITCDLIDDKSTLYVKAKSAASPKQYIDYIYVIFSLIITLFYL